MSTRAHRLVPLLVGGVFFTLLLWLLTRPATPPPPSRPTAATPLPLAIPGPALAEADPVDPPASPAAHRLLAELRQKLASPQARPREAVLTFGTEEAYRAFLARARAAGLTVLGTLDALRTVRVGYASLTALRDDLLNHGSDYADLGANHLLNPPPSGPPAKEDRAALDQVPFGNGALAFLGVPGDHAAWGRGITLAILDSGVAADRTFGPARLRALDLGLGTLPGQGAEDGHGTSVASLAAGASADAPGVAPAANLLSIRVTDAAGTSDVFTVAQGILAAVDAGARVLNISLGGYATSGVLTAAIDYAVAHGAVIVAAAGNDQAAQLTWPAADPRVVSVGAVDALGQQVLFSNSGPQLQITAPGYGVQTAWLGDQRATVSGTSASAPLVAGAIAAVLSVNPALTAAQAWQVLRETASDAGAPGADPAYGQGILNVGWAMNRHNPTYVDTAIAGHSYDASAQQMDFTVQNRSGQAVSGLTLAITADGRTSATPIPFLTPGATYVVKLPVDPAALAAQGRLQFTTELTNPANLADQVPANNRRASVLTAPKK